MLSNTRTTRFTATLPTDYLETLKKMAKDKLIPSINFAIKEAIEAYLEQIKKEKYEALMKEAAQDKEFMERTLECDADFSAIDGEVDGEW